MDFTRTFVKKRLVTFLLLGSLFSLASCSVENNVNIETPPPAADSDTDTDTLPGTLAFGRQPGGTNVHDGASFTTQPIVAAVDGNNATAASLIVTLSAYTDSSCTTAASGTLSGNTATTDSVGLATFSTLSFDTAGTIYLKATSGELTSACSTTSVSVIDYEPDTWGAQISTSGAPSVRYSHVAVWTGSEMIVWGGFNNTSGRMDTGGRYNPTTDSWGTAPSTTDAPTPRDWPTAVWTGSEMIVWGGKISGRPGGGANTDTGASYDPQTDTWTAIAASGNAAAGASGVWTGTQMIIWGGLTDWGGMTYSNSGQIYTAATNTWSTFTGTNNFARGFHSAAWTGTKMIVWGGHSGGGRPTTVHTYDPNTTSWSSTSPSGGPTGRDSMGYAWTGSKLFVWGGYNSGVLSDGFIYDPSNDSWSSAVNTTGAPSALYGLTAVWTGSEFLLWGGQDSSPANVNTGIRYNP